MALDFLAQVTPHAAWFQECCLNLRPEDASIVLPMFSSRSAPLLHTMEISFKHPEYYWNDVDADVEVEVEFDVDDVSQAINSHTIFNGHTPTLRELHLRHYLTSWCSPTLSGLTVLWLRDLYHSVRPTIAELRTVLNCMPDLERLYLHNSIHGSRYNPATLDTEKVYLPRLAHLLVDAPLSILARFLSGINIPATTQVRLGLHLEARTNADNYAPVCALLSKKFSNCGDEATSIAPIRTMVVMQTGTPPQHMFISFSASGCTRGLRTCNSSLNENCDCDIPLKVDIDWEPDTEDWSDLVVGICRIVPLARLENIILKRCRLPSALWFDILWDLGELHCIEMFHGDLSDFLLPLSLTSRPLLENSDGPTDQRTSQLFAPSLEELYLKMVKTADVEAIRACTEVT